MIRVEEQLTIGCTAEAFLGFVMDVERYAEVDDKLRTVYWVRRNGHLTEFAFRPALPGVPFSQPKAVAQMRLTPGERIDIRLAPLPLNKVNHRMARFAARFTCAPVDGGVRVTRMIEFEFRPGPGRPLGPLLARTLPGSVARELRLAKEILERGDNAT
ncbi:SRPBCC family protein [Streptomyces chrestomyceticus]|uniref:SRPBCC family protein n=1 Tax=Streptomyces chrestomyceticus TaxID=68185 RepID=UPI0033F5C7F5